MSGLAHSDLRFDSRAKQVGHRNRLLVSGWREHVSERAQPIFGLLTHRHVFLYLWIIEFADVPSPIGFLMDSDVNLPPNATRICSNGLV
jgi:hypothetical protein